MSIFKKNNTEEGSEVISADQNNMIGKGTVINGDLETHGNIRIDGQINGNVKSKAKIVLGKGSKITGNIFSVNAEVQGEVKGNLEISETLTLKNTAVITGDVSAKYIITESGAKLLGHCNIGSNNEQGRIEKETRQAKGNA